MPTTRILISTNKFFRLVFALVFLLMSFSINAEVRQYIRDYKYTANDFDTRYTSRVRAIDGVKQRLLEELGTYVASVVELIGHPQN